MQYQIAIKLNNIEWWCSSFTHTCKHTHVHTHLCPQRWPTFHVWWQGWGVWLSTHLHGEKSGLLPNSVDSSGEESAPGPGEAIDGSHCSHSPHAGMWRITHRKCANGCMILGYIQYGENQSPVYNIDRGQCFCLNTHSLSDACEERMKRWGSNLQ